MKKLLLVLLPFLALHLQAQIIPAAARADWSRAGFQGTVPDYSNVLDITTFGAIANDSIDDYPAIESAILSLHGTAGVIYFPPGNYLVQSTVVLKDSIILRGAGCDSTTLLFNFGGGAYNSFHIGTGLTQSFHPLDSGYLKDSRKVYASSAQAFLSAGDGLEIREENGAWDIQPASWAGYAVGHFCKADSVKADTIWLNEALRLDLDSALHPEIRKVVPRTMCGFECFKMIRVDDNTNGINYGFDFANASNCWMRGVESERSIGTHVSIDRSSHISITGCYFHDAHLYDGTSTRGYGVLLVTHASANLIEDNIFKHLRHAMIAKQGANGNVFAYNYSIEPNRSEPIPDYGADLCLHGHYPFANLFEGNIAQNLMIDIVWGPSGPFNTFFRNKVELYGILMSSGSVQSDRQNFVGNDVSSTQLLQGNYSLVGTGHFQSGNRVQGNVTPANTATLNDFSYYLDTVRPFFWNLQQTLPGVGLPNAVATDNNPARQRYISGGGFTLCGYTPYVDTTSVNVSVKNVAADGFGIKSCTWVGGYLQVTAVAGKETVVQARLLSVTGQLLTEQPVSLNKGSTVFQISTARLSAGIYLLEVSAGERRIVKKIVIER